jgi:DNA-binding NarL/FixJ family response regulator
MQTAAFVYRPQMPALEDSPRYGESHITPARPKALRVLVAGRFKLPVHYVSDRLLRATSRANAPDLQTVLNLLRELPPVDLVILDASLPGFAGSEDLRKIGDQAADTPVLVICNRGEEKKAAEFLRSGAAGVIPGDLSDEAVAGAIQLILSGQRFAPAELLIEPTGSDARLGELMGSLSTREQEVAQLIAQGCPNKEIACRLGLQEITIKVYASSIFRKLGVRNRTAAAARLLAEGL